MSSDPIVIVSSARTPIGDFMGQFEPLSAPALGSAAIRGALARTDVAPGDIDEVIMGCVLSAGLGQAPARQAALGAGLPIETPCSTVNKMCGSGMKALMIAHDAILAGSAKVAIAGGLENMSRSPYLLERVRAGYRMGHQTTSDHMFLDGLEDAYEKGTLMGVFAEKCADHYGFSREAQDAFTLTSLSRSQEAISSGAFKSEIEPVEVASRKKSTTFDTDELPGKARPDKIPQLRPAFRKDGTVTAANSSAISDGASALMLMRQSEAQSRGLPIQGIIRAHASAAHEPAWFTTAPIKAMQHVLSSTGWDTSQVDLFEINEAFAVVTMAAMKELSLPADRVNVLGGACALGHPIGASGARIVTTLLHALESRQLKRGIAALCIGGGEATAVAIERI